MVDSKVPILCVQVIILLYIHWIPMQIFNSAIERITGITRRCPYFKLLTVIIVNTKLLYFEIEW